MEGKGKGDNGRGGLKDDWNERGKGKREEEKVLYNTKVNIKMKGERES